MTLQPIGVVRNGVLDSTDENWGAVASEIQLRPEFAPGLRGLEAFSHVVIVFSRGFRFAAGAGLRF